MNVQYSRSIIMLFVYSLLDNRSIIPRLLPICMLYVILKKNGSGMGMKLI